MRLATARHVILECTSLFRAKACSTRAAAIAFYVVISLTPLLVMTVFLVGLVFGEAAAQGEIIDRFGRILGTEAAAVAQSAILSVSVQTGGLVATFASVFVLLLVASGVFVELQAALDAIWDARPRIRGPYNFLRARLASLGLTLAIGTLLIIVLLLDLAINAITSFANFDIGYSVVFLRIASFVFSFVCIGVLFGFIYRTLPSAPLSMRDVLIGSLVTTTLFQVGKLIVGFYISSQWVTSVLGATGALVVVLIWVYFSSLIFLVGALLTRVLSERFNDDGAA